MHIKFFTRNGFVVLHVGYDHSHYQNNHDDTETAVTIILQLVVIFINSAVFSV
jgi:hypothetical protein